MNYDLKKKPLVLHSAHSVVLTLFENSTVFITYNPGQYALKILKTQMVIRFSRPPLDVWKTFHRLTWSHDLADSRFKRESSTFFYYPFAQQSSGGDIGSVPYVCMCVRTYVLFFVCSPFVIALATSFIIQFQYNFTQILGMTIPQTSSRLSVIGLRSRSQ